MARERARFSVVLPYFNEEDFLPATLASLVAQSERPFCAILVDNGSTDRSAALARDALAGADGIEAVHLSEGRPGQCPALETGLAAVQTAYCAVCDADTVYPPHYLSAAGDRFDQADSGLVALMATGIAGAPDSPGPWLKRAKTAAMGRLFPRHCHTGGYGHLFRTEALRRAGGYSPDLWPYTLKDHELMHRVFAQGRAAYGWDLWCQPSPRRTDRRAVRWTLPERLLYQALPYGRHRWFFHDYLAPRFRARKQNDIALRQQSWRTGTQGPKS